MRIYESPSFGLFGGITIAVYGVSVYVKTII